MKKINIDGQDIYIDNSEVDYKETGVVIKDDKQLEKTQEIEVDVIDKFSDTLVDVWNDEDGK
jgi:hypothetical protein